MLSSLTAELLKKTQWFMILHKISNYWSATFCCCWLFRHGFPRFSYRLFSPCSVILDKISAVVKTSHTVATAKSACQEFFQQFSTDSAAERKTGLVWGFFFPFFFLFLGCLFHSFYIFFNRKRGGLGGFSSANEIVRLMVLATASRSVGRRSVSFPTVLLCKHPCCYVCYSFNVCEKFLMQLNYVLPSCLYK